MNLLPLRIAHRYIFSRKRHSAVNMISIVAVCGIIITTAAMVCLLSVFNGFHLLMLERLNTINPEIEVSPVKGKVISEADSVADIVGKIQGVRMVRPVIKENALAVFAGKQLPVRVMGVSGDYDKLVDLSRLVKEDGCYMLYDSLTLSDCALLGSGTAVQLRAHPTYEHQLLLYAPKREGRINLANPIGAFRTDTLFVSGVYQSNDEKFDNQSLIVSLDCAKRLFAYDKEASALHIATDTTASVASIMQSISQRLGANYQVKDRLMQQEYSFRMINIEKWITFLFIGFILIIAMFNVLSSVAVLIVEKRDDTRTLDFLGATRTMIANIFSAHTFFITMLGAVIGSILGIALCLLQEHFHLIKLNGDASVLIIQYYPVCIKALDLLAVLGITTAIAILSALVTRLLIKRQ